jgi:hypothetical protein
MSTRGTSRAADLAAQQVEQIVEAAEQAAEQIRESARAEGLRDAERELDSARKEALALGQEARREAKELVENAQWDSDQIREQTQRAVEGRVASAEKAAAEVLEEARILHNGMRRLGEALGDSAERILRDVHAAHKRMQADLRVSSSIEPAPRQRITESRARPSEPRSSPGSADLSESERIIAAAEAARPGGERPERRPSRRANPFDDLDVPSWVGRDR